MRSEAIGGERLRPWSVVSSGWDKFARAWRPSLWPVVRLVLALTPLVPFLLLLGLIWNRTPLGPWLDEWSYVPLLQAADAGTLSVADFWALFGAHFLVIPRLISLALIELTDWNRQVMMTVYLFLGVATLLLLLDGVRRTFGSKTAAMVLAGPFALLVLSLTQYENWLWAFQITFIATAFGAALCFWALTTRTGWAALGLALAGALIASLSSAPGMAVWLAFLPAVSRLGWRKLGLWVLATLGVMITYFSSPRSQQANWSDPLDVVGYTLSYLGWPIGYGDPARSIVGALVSALLVLVSTLVLYRLGTDSMVLWTWLGLTAFAVGSGLLTAVGRAHLLPIHVIDSRYLAFSAFWWVAVIALVTLSTVRLVRAQPQPSANQRSWRDRLLIGVNAVALLALLIGLIASNRAGFEQGSAWMDFPKQQQGCLLAPRYASDVCLSIAHPIPATRRSAVLYLEAKQFGIFRGHKPIDVAQLHALDKPALGAIDIVNRQLLASLPASEVSITAATPVASQAVNVEDPSQKRPRRPRKRRTDGARQAPAVATAPVPASATDVATASKRVVVVPVGQTIPVSGWAMDPTSNGPAGGVFITVDDAVHVWAAYGQARPESAEAYGEPSDAATGFIAFLPPEALPVGRHILRLKVLTPDMDAYTVVPQVVELVVEEPPSIDVTALTELEESTFGIIEQVNGRYFPDQELWPYVADEPIEIVGFAIDVQAGTSARSAFISVDDRWIFPAQVSLPRGEIAVALMVSNKIDHALVGFKAVIPAGALPPGRHTLEVRVVTQDGRSYYAPSPRLMMQIDVA